MKTIPYSRQHIDEDDINAVTEVLRSDFLTQGAAIPSFEDALKTYCQSEHAIAVSSGTAGLHLLCLALNISKGDRVWTSPISFVASSNCALYVGATVDFVDINTNTGNICLHALKAKLELAQKTNTLPKLLIVVHFSGLSCEMDRIAELTAPYNITIIEDAAHALGATYQNKPVGSCVYSQASLLSFHPVKSITTGEGGAITTSDHAFAEKLRLLRSHGITRDPLHFKNHAHGAWYYEMLDLGFHYRLTDIQAALGTSQLQKLDNFIAKRREIAQRYTTLLQDLPLILPTYNHESAWHLYAIQLKAPLDKTRKEVFDFLRHENIGVNVHYIPIHLQPYYQGLGFKEGNFPQAEHFYNRVLSLPIYPDLTLEQQDHIVAKLWHILKC